MAQPLGLKWVMTESCRARDGAADSSGPRQNELSPMCPERTPWRWCARQDSNLRPLASEANALIQLSYGRVEGVGALRRGELVRPEGLEPPTPRFEA